MNEILEKFAIEKAILLGVCGASRMDWLEPVLRSVQTPFVSRDIERRINPRIIMPSAEGIIVIGVGSHAAPPAPEDITLRGRIAGIGANKDYHRTVKTLLEELTERLCREKIFEYKIFTDAGQLNERALAVRAGLGFIGKNRSVISKKFGSFFNIGYMIIGEAEGRFSCLAEAEDEASEAWDEACGAGERTSCFMEAEGKGTKQENRLPDSSCGDCRRCIEACPGGALENGFDISRCCSYLTQRKDAPSTDEMKIMGDWLYGCDICQDCCPFNVGVERCAADNAYPLLEDCVDITDVEFRRRYSESSLYWIGAETFRRNAVIASRNRDG